MGCDWYQLTEPVVVIVLPPSQITEVCVSLVDFCESFLRGRIGGVLGVMFQSEIPICLLNFVEAGVARYAQNLIIGSPSMGIFLVKERFFTLPLETILVIELLEGFIGILSAVFMDQSVIVIATAWIGQHEISFTDVRELPLS